MPDRESYLISIDDDPLIAPILERVTSHSVVAFSTVAGFRSRAPRYQPLAVFLDVHLADECGISLIPELRVLWPQAPILVMTSDTGTTRITEALIAGAQDFLRKPLDHEEVRARLQVRVDEVRQSFGGQHLELANGMYHKAHRMLVCGEKRLFLTEIEGRLLEVLAAHRGHACSRELLLAAGWPGLTVSGNSLEQRLSGLRKTLKLSGFRVALKTIRGEGYLLEVL